MQFRLTFSHGFSHVFEADRLEDNGHKLELWNGDTLVQRIMDSDIVSCERLDFPSPTMGDVYTHKGGVRLYNQEANIVAVYRSIESAKGE